MRAIARAAAHRFSRRYSYPVPHLEQMIDHSGSTFFRYAAAGSLAGRMEHIPPAASHAARITAVRTAGCAACLELSRKIAIESGVPPADVNDLACGDPAKHREGTVTHGNEYLDLYRRIDVRTDGSFAAVDPGSLYGTDLRNLR